MTARMLPAISRRRVLAALGALLGAPALAQRKPRYVVGVMRATAPSQKRDASWRLVESLRRRGYESGRNLVVEQRYAGGRLERLPALARELVAVRPDVIVAIGSSAALAARDATSTVPVVMFGNFDPLKLGLVTSLARPGGNVTGVLIAAQGTLAAKRLELLRDAVPGATRIGVLAPDDALFAAQLDELRRAAQRIGVALTVVTVRNGDYDAAFESLAAAKVQALFVGGHTFFARDGDRIIALAAKHRQPATYEWPEQAEDGGLMGYGADLDELYDRVAFLVDRVLSGVSPAALPVEQPTKAELVINLRTAKALGIAIPPAVQQRADRVLD